MTAEPTSRSAYFTIEAGLYNPTEHARGWWRHDSLLGRAIVAAIGRELGRAQGEPELIPARMTIDLHGMAPFAPVRIETRTVRQSRRLKLAEAVLFVGDTEFARASCQFLRPGAPPEHAAPGPAPWSVPHPDALLAGSRRINRLSDVRLIAGDMGSPLPRMCWMRELQDIVLGETPSPWEVIAGQADFGSPWAHSGQQSEYINTDVTTHIHRLPVSEWIGFEATGHEASQGIAVGHCRLHDLRGPIGHVATTAVAMKRRQ